MGSDLLEAPCLFCGYNGQGYYQAGTHHPDCPWFSHGLSEARAKELRDIVRALWVDRAEWRQQARDVMR